MTSVKRYNPTIKTTTKSDGWESWNIHSAAMEQDKAGRYVSYAAYKKFQKELDQLQNKKKPSRKHK